MAIDDNIIRRHARPGINKNIRLTHFTEIESKIICNLSSEWYITNGGGVLKPYTKLPTHSQYKYFLMKPTELFRTMFNLEREIVVILSPYNEFEPRTFDAIDMAFERCEKLRLEKICSVIISKDNHVEKKITDILKNDQESQIVIPFSYNELLSKYDKYFIQNRFRKHFYSRDLFSFEAPLKKELFFFGRKDIVHQIVNRQLSNENSGLFGLRKTGKTSVIFAVKRVLNKNNSNAVFIDCQNPAFHQRRWYKALWYIINEFNNSLKESWYLMDDLSNKFTVKYEFKPEEKYTESDAPILFEKELLKLFRQLNNKNILIIFDEIENISFQTSPSGHWSNGWDFILFWQTIRSLFQKLDNVFSFLIVGTNPACIETPQINGKDNPIYQLIPYQYIPRFELNETKEMVCKLGRYMGLEFDEIIYSLLTEDFGGHPFLIRHVCSNINKFCPISRPIRITKPLYEKVKKEFLSKYSNYLQMILNVLQLFYKDEYKMLEYLALDDLDNFNSLSKISQEYTNHLIGYGLIEKTGNDFSFRIDVIKDFIVNKNKYKKLTPSLGDIYREVSERRNNLEPKIRQIVRMQLQSFYGKKEGEKIILNIFESKKREEHLDLKFDELFDPNKSKLYLQDMINLIIKKWDRFEHIFGRDKTKFERNITFINKQRIDAHAKKISNDDFQFFRICISELENQADDFLGI